MVFMGVSTGRIGAAFVVLVGLMAVHAQAPLGQGGASRAIVHETSLPAIDRGLRDQDPPRPARTGADAARLRGDATPYRRGSIIVKFRDDAPRGAAAAATAQVSGEFVDRSSWANFDIIDIPETTDPEAAAAAMRARPDVEYAQPRYLNHAMARPNDTLYSNQWNFPAIDMERAWDIQPGASSEIVVAVLDSGMAFRDITVRYDSRFAFRLTSSGPLYPALGRVEIPFAAAPELGASGSARFV